MNKSDLKKVLKPLLKECIKEVIFEEGVLSGLITEVAQGLGNINVSVQSTEQPAVLQSSQAQTPNPSVVEARKQLSEVKASLQKAAGLQGIFEGTKPMPSRSNAQSSKYGALRDKDPSDAGVNIDGLLKMTGGWSHLT
jgi:hypothetical protein